MPRREGRWRAGERHHEIRHQQPSGRFRSYFRDDKFVAKDFVQKRVLPYEDQQLSWTFGGPDPANRAHFFVNYEYERRAADHLSYSSQYPTSTSITAARAWRRKAEDVWTSSSALKTHMTSVATNRAWNAIRLAIHRRLVRHPSSAIRHAAQQRSRLTLTQVLGRGRPQRNPGGYVGFYWIQDSKIPWRIILTQAFRPAPRSFSSAATPSGKDTAIHTKTKTWRPTRFKRQLTDVVLEGRAPQLEGRQRIYGYQQNPVFLCNRCMGIYDVARRRRSRRISSSCSPCGTTFRLGTWPQSLLWCGRTRSGVGEMKAYAPLQIVLRRGCRTIGRCRSG